jgi:hypothetical protein
MTIPKEVVEFRSRPFLCGAIGVWAEDAMRSVMQSSPPGLTRLHASPDAVVFATDPGMVRQSSKSISWELTGLRPTAGDELRAGVTLVSDGACLYTDSLGFTEVYYRRVGDAVFFASRIAPLLAIGGGRMDTDWQAWADIVALGYPVDDRTPFLQIRRMTAGMRWRTRRGSGPVQQMDTPFWAASERGANVAPSDMASMVAQRIPRFLRRRPVVLLSGGWDSRMLAGLVSDRSLLRPNAWTTSPDDGWDEDIVLAGPVASSLRMKHHVEVPNEDAFHGHATATRRRVQYQTWMHTWLSPLARRLEAVGAPIIDGIAGDVLLKNLFVGAETASITNRTERMRSAWASLSAGAGLGNDNVFTPELRSFVTETSWANFRQATDHIPDESYDATVAVLLTRTVRGVGSSPLWVFGPENDVCLPFLDPAVISASLTVPIADKAGGAYYRQVLAVAAAQAASLPSTNDGLPKPERGPQRQSSPASLRWMADLIASSDDALGLLNDRTRKAVLGDSAELVRISAYSTSLRMLQIASMFAEWQRDYRDVLNDVGNAPWCRR